MFTSLVINTNCYVLFHCISKSCYNFIATTC